ncbi:MAG: protein involved in polysaccharide export with SLBB domain [Glaciecola sp.]|jgi:protein involved in polysaccharide export with SLBB domain
MKSLKIEFIAVLFFLGCHNLAFTQEVESNYKMSSDDIISITVFNEPDLSLNEVRISSNGAISMPLLGQVEVAQLTVVEVESKLTSLYLDGYLKKPKVSVGIIEYRPFYINGQVQFPGSYPYRQGLTVEKAITMAGGFTIRASRKSISLISEKDQNNTILVSLSDKVKPGDVITVNESFF